MTVSFRPLRSNYGFQSPGFTVSPTGQLTVTSGSTLELNDRVDINDALYVSDQIYIDNIALLDLSDPLVNKLGVNITESYLTKLATLQDLNVVGDVDIQDSSNNVNLSIVSGQVILNSTTLGNIDNIEIGATTPADAFFNDVEIGQTGNNKSLNVVGTVSVSISASIPTITNTTITSTTGNIATVNATDVNSTTVDATTANITTVNTTDIAANDITIVNTPVDPDHATRKDYVDSRISAFAIAFGA
jgi:hypothetical protein